MSKGGGRKPAAFFVPCRLLDAFDENESAQLIVREPVHRTPATRAEPHLAADAQLIALRRRLLPYLAVFQRDHELIGLTLTQCSDRADDFVLLARVTVGPRFAC